MSRRDIAAAAAAVAAVTVAARLVGLVRTAVMSATVGDSAFVGNTYGTANTLPNVVFEVVAGGALAGLVVPVLAGAVARGESERVDRVTSALLTWTVVALVPVALVGAVLARPLMTALTVGVDDPALRAAEVDLGARMLRVFMPQVVLYGVGIVLTGVLQSHRRFLGPALAPLLSSLVVVTAYLVYADRRGSGLPGEVSRTEELILSVGTTLGVVVLSLSLLVPLRRLGLRLRPTLRMPDGVGARVRRLAAAGAAGVVAQQVAIVVALAVTNSQPGAVVAYQLAYAVFLLPWGVLAVPLATSAFPALAESGDDGAAVEYAATLASTARLVVAVVGGAAAVLWAVHEPVAALLPFRPNGVGSVVSARDAVGDGIAAFAVGLVPYSLLALLTRALYARSRTRAAAVATVSGFATAAAGALVLVAAMPERPVLAVAAAHSAGMAVAALMLAAGVTRDAGRSALAGLRATTARAGAAAVVAAAIGVLAAGDGGGDRIAAATRSAAATTAAVAVYVAVLVALREPELLQLRALVRRSRG